MEKIIIAGGGPAGVSAALYAARADMSPLLINNGIGALEKAEKIENYYGTGAPLSGAELYENGLKQARALGVRIMEAEVLGVGGFDTFEVHTTQGTIETESLILATGSKRKKPSMKGLKELEGRGVSYCAVCDAFFYKGKAVGVLGNSDFALHEAEELLPLAGSVTIYTNGQTPEFSRKHTIPVNTMQIQAIEGEEQVTGIRLVSNDSDTEGQEMIHTLDGIFVALGIAGSTEIARQMGAELTDKGHIRVNENMETSIPGLYAAGDCTGGLLQVAKAVYQGAEAGIHAIQYVRTRQI